MVTFVNLRVWKNIALLFGTALLLSCVPNRPYRLGNIHDEELGKLYPDQKPWSEQVQVSEQHSFHISFVEFDEKGDFWDRRQLARTARLIDKTRTDTEKPIFLVTYIHGWHHNAKDRPLDSKNPGDVQTFRCLLSELAVSKSLEGFQVHGVYIGWRGRVIEGPLDYLSFLNRKGAALRAAGTPVTETIFELIRQARKHPGSKCIVIGHSFGALLLEKAMAQAITGSFLSRERRTEAPADLILLVNSAAESIYAKEMTDMFARVQYGDAHDRNRPLMVSITSKGDTATGGWFPIGTFLPNLFAHRRYHWGGKYGPSSDDTDQNVYLTTTPGHNKLLFTHWVDRAAPPPLAPSNEAVARRANRITRGDCAKFEERNPAFEQNMQKEAPDWKFATSSKSNPDQFDWWQIHAFQPDKRTPYWIMQVPKAIIPNHTPIFTSEGRAMMAALFKIANENTEGARHMNAEPVSAE